MHCTADMNGSTLVIASLISTTLLAGSAVAEPAPEAVPHDAMPAVDGGLEIAVAVNAATSVGDIGGGMEADDVVGTAGELELQIGHRLTPYLTIGFYSTAQAFADGSTGARDVYTGSAGVEADFHLRPHFATDPWISLGSGVRGLWIQDGGDSVVVGAELARLQLGIDFRVDEDFAVGPVIGATATLYGAEKTPMQDFAELTDKGITWTLSAGIAGRFNAFGTRK